MYSVHTTPGFIINAQPYGEAGKVLQIFTRELGLVTATAQGVRLEKSKLRYHTVDLSRGKFSLVRGKDLWRLVGAETEQFAAYPQEAQKLVARLAKLLRRLLQGEDAEPALYDCLSDGLDYVSRPETGESPGLQAVEVLIVFRLLQRLGYIGANKDLAAFWEASVMTPDLVEQASVQKKALIQQINQALSASHL